MLMFIFAQLLHENYMIISDNYIHGVTERSEENHWHWHNNRLSLDCMISFPLLKPLSKGTGAPRLTKTVLQT